MNPHQGEVGRGSGGEGGDYTFKRKGGGLVSERVKRGVKRLKGQGRGSRRIAGAEVEIFC